MLDQKNQDTVMLVVQDLVAKNAMFTHYDVTSNVRRIVGNYVPHYGQDGVQRFVSDLWDNGDIVFGSDYTRSLNTLPNGKQALVYHNAGDDVCYYDTNDAVVQIDPTTAPTSVFDPDPVASDSDPVASPDPIIDTTATDLDQGANVDPFDGVVYRNTDLRGRLGVPASMIRKLGVKPFDAVTVFPYNELGHDVLVVCPGSKADVIDDAVSYTVARDGEVRISSAMLEKIGCSQKHSIEHDNRTNEIVITSY